MVFLRNPAYLSIPFNSFSPVSNMGQTISYYADPSLLPNPMNMFRSAHTQQERPEIWINSYTNGAKWGACALVTSLVSHKLMLKHSKLYPKIDKPRQFFIHCLFVLGMFQYGFEAKEVEMMDKIKKETAHGEQLEELEQKRKFLDEIEKTGPIQPGVKNIKQHGHEMLKTADRK